MSVLAMPSVSLHLGNRLIKRHDRKLVEDGGTRRWPGSSESVTYRIRHAYDEQQQQQAAQLSTDFAPDRAAAISFEKQLYPLGTQGSLN
jgi:hypothetical protein